jgi:hypothetical protein
MPPPADDPPGGTGPDPCDDLVEIDLVKLNRAIGVSLTPAATPVAQDLLEPLTDDLHHLMQRVHILEQGQTDLLARVEAVSQAIAENTRGTAVSLDRLHRELLGDRRVTVDRRVIAALAPAVDSLREMQASLPPGEESPVSRQLIALISITTNALQRLGFTRFEPAVGDPFDPSRMEALGTADGPPGTVVGVLQCGYLYGQGVERPAGVLLARPEPPACEPTQPPDEEDAP